MKRKIRAFLLAWVIAPRLVGKQKLAKRKDYTQIKHSWKVGLRWYSPAVWAMFLFTMVRGILKGAALGFVGVWKATFAPRPGTFSTVLEDGEKMKWYMYY